MLSPASQLTSHRILTTSAILAVTFIILLTLYNPRDATAASNGSLVQLSGDKPTSDATISTPGNEQETGKITADNASPSAIAETSAVNVAMSSATAVPNEPRRAFVAFLEAHTGTNRGDEAQGMTTEDEDDYFVGVSHRPNNLIFLNH